MIFTRSLLNKDSDLKNKVILTALPHASLGHTKFGHFQRHLFAHSSYSCLSQADLIMNSLLTNHKPPQGQIISSYRSNYYQLLAPRNFHDPPLIRPEASFPILWLRDYRVTSFLLAAAQQLRHPLHVQIS